MDVCQKIHEKELSQAQADPCDLNGKRLLLNHSYLMRVYLLVVVDECISGEIETAHISTYSYLAAMLLSVIRHASYYTKTVKKSHNDMIHTIGVKTVLMARHDIRFAVNQPPPVRDLIVLRLDTINHKHILTYHPFSLATVEPTFIT